VLFLPNFILVVHRDAPAGAEYRRFGRIRKIWGYYTHPLPIRRKLGMRERTYAVFFHTKFHRSPCIVSPRGAINLKLDRFSIFSGSHTQPFTMCGDLVCVCEPTVCSKCSFMSNFTWIGAACQPFEAKSRKSHPTCNIWGSHTHPRSSIKAKFHYAIQLANRLASSSATC